MDEKNILREVKIRPIRKEESSLWKELMNKYMSCTPWTNKSKILSAGLPEAGHCSSTFHNRLNLATRSPIYSLASPNITFCIGCFSF